MSERWMPKNGKGYWFVLDTIPVQTAWVDSQYDIARWEAGNVFKTHDQALIASINIKALLLSLHDNNLATNLQDKQDKLQDKPLPKLTTEVFDRPDCPEWAKYAAVDKDGKGFYYLNKPKKKENKKWSLFGVGDYYHIGTFDSSDWQNSLIERPAKLPDWCKPGEWVYCTTTNNYGKILSVDKEEVNICIPPDGTFSAKTNMMLKYGRTARLRPYNAEEMKALVGKVVEFDAFAQLVLMYDGKDNAILAGDGDWLSESTLLKDYTIDGKNCGVLEHLENGEWVK